MRRYGDIDPDEEMALGAIVRAHRECAIRARRLRFLLDGNPEARVWARRAACWLEVMREWIEGEVT